ncbi:hypothetical protein R5R35_002745 [Gryllus longicercus]|uniref:Uncharacterized protein n=1 Tax=Gryllus longicercus TaxID=2509291 RepID=A0AAN9Z629_9ORTH|nr:uncharacterized protein GBIM_14670 [Gryllus bimaculatus]
MVQGSKQVGPSRVGAFDRDPAARKASYEAMQKSERDRRSASQQQQQQQQKQYGAWGPVFKDKQHFAQMHFC